jgi:hypothetical protein
MNNYIIENNILKEVIDYSKTFTTLTLKSIFVIVLSSLYLGFKRYSEYKNVKVINQAFESDDEIDDDDDDDDNDDDKEEEEEEKEEDIPIHIFETLKSNKISQLFNTVLAELRFDKKMNGDIHLKFDKIRIRNNDWKERNITNDDFNSIAYIGSNIILIEGRLLFNNDSNNFINDGPIVSYAPNGKYFTVKELLDAVLIHTIYYRQKSGNYDENHSAFEGLFPVDKDNNNNQFVIYFSPKK